MVDTSVDETERSFWHDDPQDRAPMPEAIDTIKDLKQRLATVEAERDRLKDENDRLRKTLEEIRDDRSFGDNAAPLLRSIAKLELIRIAKTALREVDGGKD